MGAGHNVSARYRQPDHPAPHHDTNWDVGSRVIDIRIVLQTIREPGYLMVAAPTPPIAAYSQRLAARTADSNDGSGLMNGAS